MKITHSVPQFLLLPCETHTKPSTFNGGRITREKYTELKMPRCSILQAPALRGKGGGGGVSLAQKIWCDTHPRPLTSKMDNWRIALCFICIPKMESELKKPHLSWCWKWYPKMAFWIMLLTFCYLVPLECVGTWKKHPFLKKNIDDAVCVKTRPFDAFWRQVRSQSCGEWPPPPPEGYHHLLEQRERWTQTLDQIYCIKYTRTMYVSLELNTKELHLPIFYVYNSRYDQSFLASKLGEYMVTYTGSDDYWIGLSDTDSPGTYQWVDGSYPTLSAWGPGQPGVYSTIVWTDCIIIYILKERIHDINHNEHDVNSPNISIMKSGQTC